MKKEIKIAGAGLSGLVAGINLLRSGCKVRIFEKNNGIGERFTNDLQGLANWMAESDILELLEAINIKKDFFTSPLDRGMVFGPGINNRADFVASKPLIYLVRRGGAAGCLDMSLKNQFLDEGGQIEFNNPAGPEGADIIATGPQKASFRTIGYNFDTDLKDIICEIMDNDLAPKAYAYLLVRDGRGTLGTVLTERFNEHGDRLARTVEFFKKEAGLVMKNEEKFGGFADFSPAKSAVKNGRLYVGEAAGFIDAVTGFGMFYAIKSGYFAARSIIDGSDYDKLWKDDFGDSIKVSMVNRFLLGMVPNQGMKLVPGFVKKNQKVLFDLAKKGYEFGPLKKIIYPAACLFGKMK